jgi:hypothetical protein
VSYARAIAPALGGLLAMASPAAAQRHAGGPWFDAAVGWGRLSVVCTGCTTVERTNGTSLRLSIGGSPSPTVLVGAEGQIWTSMRGGKSEQVRSLSLIGQWYPWQRAGFFLRGGTGLVDGPVAPDDSTAARTFATGKGVGFVIGFGYDVPVGRHFSLRLMASTHINALGDLVVSGVTAEDTIAYVSQLSLGLTLR